MVDCKWGGYKSWSECEKNKAGTCVKARYRSIEIHPQNGGKKCTGETYQYAACNKNDCPIDCEWNQWLPWTKCSASCGKGKRTRQRTKKVQKNDLGKYCEGEAVEGKECNSSSCKIPGK